MSTEVMNQTQETAGSKKGFYITPEEVEEFEALTDEGEIDRARKHRKACKKQDIHPTPPSKWVVCEVCGYRTPGSLISHITKEHGGRNNYAKQLGTLPEMVQLCTDDLMARFVTAGATGNAAKEAAEAA